EEFAAELVGKALIMSRIVPERHNLYPCNFQFVLDANPRSMIHARHARGSHSQSHLAARIPAAGDLSRGEEGQETHACQHIGLADRQDRSIATGAAGRFLFWRLSRTGTDPAAQSTARACRGGAGYAAQAQA